MYFLEINALEYGYGKQMILPRLSLTVHQGDFVCLLGPSGSGKTTLLRLIAGLEKVQRGRVLLEQVILSDEQTHIPPHQRHVGMVFQQPTLFPMLTVADNVAFGLRAQSAVVRDMRVKDLLQHVGLADYAMRYPHQLSGGQQHRVALARALAPKPKLLLLDEPFAHLDTALRTQLRGDTLRLVKEEGVTCVMVTHDPEEAMMMGDQLVLLDDSGHVRQSGTAHDIYHHPVDRYAALALGDMNFVTAQCDQGKVSSPLGVFAVDSNQSGAVLMAVRPQDCKLDAQGGGVIATVEHVLCAGAQDYITLRLESGDALRACVAHDHHFRMNDNVGVCVAADRVHVFGS